MNPVQPLSRVRCRLGRLIVTGVLVALVATGCGGGDPAAPASPNSPTPPSGIGAAGGTVNGPTGAKVVVPAGALASNVEIAIAESSTGAPALPATLAITGKIFAFTPHGTA